MEVIEEKKGAFAPGCHGPLGGPCGGLGDFEGDPNGVGLVTMRHGGKTFRGILSVLRGSLA